jgi:hypothetical protein
MRNVRQFAVPVRTASPSKSWDEISVMGEGCDTPSVTVEATMFYSTSAMQSKVNLCLSSLSKLNLSFEYY